jgi:cysteine desulfurase
MRIYLDHNATTPVDPAVADAVCRVVTHAFGNPSSAHAFGQQAKSIVDTARSQVAALLGGRPTDVVFTSGGTESDNLAIRGAAELLAARDRRHLITTGIEHEAVLHTVRSLERLGWRTTILGVDERGIVDPEALREALADDTGLVSVMHANNEIGTIQPIAELAALAHQRGALFHTDAVQTVGKIPVDVASLETDLLSLSGHKLNAPKGIGALWVKRGVRLGPQLTGGRHERGRRAGTENVPGCVGLGLACERAAAKLATEATRLADLRDRLERGILARVSRTAVNGEPTTRVPNTTNISFDGVEAESLLIALDLDGVAVSTGSACSSGTLEPSHVLRAMGLSPHRAQNAIRFSLGAGNTAEEIDHVVGLLPAIVEKLRALTHAGTRTSA